MGNLMKAFLITLLLQNSISQIVNVSKNKKKDKKSIELLMESDVKNPETNESEINRLIINSTYDDSIFISTYLKQGVNVTVVQDGKSVVDVQKIESEGERDDNAEEEEDEEEDAIKRMEQSVEALMRNKTFPDYESGVEVRRLLDAVNSLKKFKTNKHSLKRLSQKTALLNSHNTRRGSNSRDDVLHKMVELLKNRVIITKANNETLESIDNILKVTREAAMKTPDEGSRNYALKIIQEAMEATKPLRSKADTLLKQQILEEIARSIRGDYFVPSNASTLVEYIVQLNAMQATFKKEANRKIVNSLKQEIVNLTEAVNVIDMLDVILKTRENDFELVTGKVEELKRFLAEVIESSRNQPIKRKASALWNELERKVDEQQDYVEEKKNWMKVLNAINQTLYNSNGFGGKTGLHLIRKKLNDVMDVLIIDEDVKAKTLSLISSVNLFEEEIDVVLGLFDKVSDNIHFPKDDQEADNFERDINKIKNLTRTVNDPMISIKAHELINRIERFIEEFRIKNQIKNINSVLSSMNRSLESAESEAEIQDDEIKLNMLENAMQRVEASKPIVKDNIQQILQDIEQLKRKIPSKSHRIHLRDDVNELLKTLNGYLQKPMPEMKEKIEKVEANYELLIKMNATNLDGLKDRIFIASKDYKRIMTGLETIKAKIKEMNFKKINYDAAQNFTKLEDTMEILNKLEVNLLQDPTTNELVKKTFTIIQDVEHGNDTLKQLHKMIIFNTKLLNSSNDRTMMTMPATVPIKQVSLHPFIPNEPGEIEVEKTATEASDLDKADHNASSKNSK